MTFDFSSRSSLPKTPFLIFDHLSYIYNLYNHSTKIFILIRHTSSYLLLFPYFLTFSQSTFFLFHIPFCQQQIYFPPSYLPNILSALSPDPPSKIFVNHLRQIHPSALINSFIFIFFSKPTILPSKSIEYLFLVFPLASYLAEHLIVRPRSSRLVSLPSPVKVYRRVFGRARPGSSLVYTYLAISFAENVVVLGRTDTRAIRSFAGVSPCTPAVSISAGNNAVDGSYSRGPPSRRRKRGPAGAPMLGSTVIRGWNFRRFVSVTRHYLCLCPRLCPIIGYTVRFSTVRLQRSASSSGSSRSGRKDLILHRD